MEVVGSYRDDGYTHLKGLVAPQVVAAFLRRLARDLGKDARPSVARDEVLARPAFSIPGSDYSPMTFFLWGMTPLASRLVGQELLPTYNYFRVYRAGDVCRVHSDREACEHSMSLTLGYSDDRIWDLEVGRTPVAGPSDSVANDFGDEAHESIGMAPGDAVLYRGVHRRHGRTAPNPNRWSAHLFLHWVARDGPYADKAFDGVPPDEGVTINFG